MSRIAYVNGQYVRHAEAGVHIEDRGYQFADGVYEVCQIRHGHIIDMTLHLNRLDRSLGELRIAAPMGRPALTRILREVARRNRVRDGLVYMQVTRGVAPRDHVFPKGQIAPSLVVTAKSVNPAKLAARARDGIAVISVPENRWDRVDIKSVGLLSNCLVKQQAAEAGATEAWYVDGDGHVTEGGSTNAWIVTRDGVLVTRPADHGILRGITRTVLLAAIARLGLRFEERPFTIAEALEAREAFVSSASQVAVPVVRLDGRAIANGHPGETVRALQDAFYDHAEQTAI